MIIRSNIPGLNIQNKLNKNNKRIATSMGKLSSGLRINRASDDSAVLSISEKMRAQIRGLEQAQRNVQDGISLIQTADSGLSDILDNLQRMRELAVQSANDTLTNGDRQEIQKEIEQIKQGINGIASHTEFNGIKLLDNASKSTVTLTSWKTIDSGVTTALTSVVSNNNSFIVVGRNKTILTSPDGNMWSSVPPFTANPFSLTDIASNGSKFVAVGDYNTVLTSYDGQSWEIKQMGPSGYAVNNIKDVLETAGGFVAVSNGGSTEAEGLLLTSLYGNYGDSWGGRVITSHPLNSIATNGSQYVVVGGNGAILTSTDLIHWTPETSGTSNNLSKIKWSDNHFIAVGDNGAILTSSDGSSWTPQTSGTSENLYDIAKISPNEYIAVGANGTILSSTDGSTWTSQTSGTSNALKGIVSNGSTVLAVGDNGTIVSSSTTIKKYSLNLQVGANSGNVFRVELTDAKTTSLGIDDVDLSTRQGAEFSISKVDTAIQIVSSERGKFGAYQNALEHIHNNVVNYEMNLTDSESRIRDVDMAKEMVKLTKNQLLNQVSQAMLTQANQQQQAILQLLKS